MNSPRTGPRLLPLALALMCPLVTSSAAAQNTSDDLQALRAQLQALRNDYEARIAALEKRLANAEQAAGRAEQMAVQAQEVGLKPAMPEAPGATASESAFNPAMSLILAGNYTRLSRDPKTYTLGGFYPSRGEVAPAARSFSLGESELSIAANIDPLLRGQFTASLAADGTASVEEAHIQTLQLGQGFSLKGGRYLSGVGYLNEQHSHAWDFADAPLVYKAFFGGQLKNDGVQLKWLAPTEDTFLEVGAEAARGGAFPSTDTGRNGSSLNALFAHLGGEVGEAHTWRAGLSYVSTHAQERPDSDSAPSYSFSGDSRTAMADFVWKWAPQGNATQRSFKLQGEWMQRQESGTLNQFASGSGPYRARQSGAYLQGVVQFLPQWRVGVRFDRLAYGSVEATPLLSALAPWNPKRSSVMVDWNPSEFSRLRLQFARDESRPFEPDHQLWFQYIVSLGAHGAHKY